MDEISNEVRDLLDGPNYAHVATLLPDGAPHTVPVWIAREGDRIAFLTGPESRKARNIERDPRVAFSLTRHDDPFTMASIRGRVVERLDGDRAWEVIDRMAQQYLGGPYPRGEERVVFLVQAERAWAQSFG
jgi:PPOX class probable F420-dependent enzyme